MRRSVHADGFTLIELLVVISIIALLMAVLLPALNAARDTAKSVQCLSTQRQLGLAFHMYMDQNDGFYPPFYRKPANADEWKWPRLILAGGYVSTGLAFTCPTKANSLTYTAWHHATPQSAADGPSFFYGHPSYGYNYKNLGGESYGRYSTSVTNYASMVTPRQSDIKHASAAIVATDTNSISADGNHWGGDYVVHDTVDTWAAGIARMGVDHLGSVNVLWADGHASSQHVGDKQFPHQSEPFTHGDDVGNPDNHWDRE